MKCRDAARRASLASTACAVKRTAAGSCEERRIADATDGAGPSSGSGRSTKADHDALDLYPNRLPPQARSQVARTVRRHGLTGKL